VVFLWFFCGFCAKTTKTTRNPGFASGKSNKPLSLESIKVQYGNPNSEEGPSLNLY
jgi:hypothetical protein